MRTLRVVDIDHLQNLPSFFQEDLQAAEPGLRVAHQDHDPSEDLTLAYMVDSLL
jgi:hypothetical protein